MRANLLENSSMNHLRSPDLSPPYAASAAHGGIAVRMIVLCLLALVLIALPTLDAGLRAAELLVELTQPGAHPWLTAGLSAVETRDTFVELAGRHVRARLYTPHDNAHAPGLVLLHGVHPRGIDEPRLIAFARSLAAAGTSVLTPELHELLDYRIEPGTIAEIEQLSAAHARALGQASVGVVGISFAGGLALIAAAQQHGTKPIAFVVTLGAHHDLLRLTRYYAHQDVRGPGGERSAATPHPYGSRVMIREHLAQLFRDDELDAARAALDMYLHDRHKEARELAARLSGEHRHVLQILVGDAADPELDALLLRASAEAEPALRAASPVGKLADLQVPVFLVHGTSDPIIPSIETLWLAHELPTRVYRRVVITPLLRHAEFPEPPSARESFELVGFMTEVLRQAQSAAFTKSRADP